MNSKVRHHLADLLESERCFPISSHELAQIRQGNVSQNKLKTIVAMMKAEGCGLSHAASIQPAKTLSLAHFSVFPVDSSHDNVFHAFLHGLSFIIKHKAATATNLKRSTKALRGAVVETVLKTKSLQNAMARDPSRTYQRQFEVRYGSEGKRAFSEYSRKMQDTAFASFTEIAALSMHSGIEIHIYDATPRGFSFVARYAPTGPASRKRRYVIRLLRRPKSHFDVLVPEAFRAHQNRGFWAKVDTHVLGKLGGNAVNSPENVLKRLHAAKNNARKSGNTSNLPNENAGKKNNFSWNSPPTLASFSSPSPSPSS